MKCPDCGEVDTAICQACSWPLAAEVNYLETELRRALLSYHLLAHSQKLCGPSLDRRCWACAEMDWPGGDR